MRAPWERVSYPRALLVTLAAVLAIALLYGGLTSTTAFGAYNSAWDGASELRDLSNSQNAETALLQNTTTYADHSPNGSVAFVLSPDTEYTPREADRVERFVRRGGTLVVAEDFDAQSNALLDSIGAEARFDGALLRDERNHDTAPTLPLAENLTDHPYTATVDRLTLNRGTPVEPGNATVVATTSNYSYLDANLNSQLDDAETMQKYPVAAVESLGAGDVVAIGDPSIFINAMLQRPGNQAFASALVAAHDTTLVDVSHLDALPPLVRAQFALRSAPLLQITVGFGLVLLVTYLSEAAALTRNVRRRLTPDGRNPALDAPVDPETDREAVAAWVRERHPDWDAGRVRRVTDRVMARTSEGQHDD
ncbi:DUF4350 domain-containing protein [Halosimplex pelagicum]|uniref:DUF4350 domain-containing protein n=1 Tax=Halosimplex pelagicum TaxID=869886 RepID=A0A7D5P5K4_9EURY|nr:DUF4350 domain-containing protein [Halosimplex pelagicum]QLH81346.1 DUF4350 domain-containing protein [Halosimplex pelagicum]